MDITVYSLTSTPTEIPLLAGGTTLFMAFTGAHSYGDNSGISYPDAVLSGSFPSRIDAKAPASVWAVADTTASVTVIRYY